MRRLIILRRVVGDSMLPGLKPGNIVLSLPLKVRVGDVVVARQADREVVKRVASIKYGEYALIGDNSVRSTDSRTYGTVKKDDLLGRVLLKLPSFKV